MTRQDERLLRRAVTLAGVARKAGEAPFGSLLAERGGRVLAEEHNTVLSDNDITAHPELKLARWAAQTLDAVEAATVTMYTSCEPCQMCAGAIARSNLGQVVFAMSTAQLNALKASGAIDATPARGPALFNEALAAVEGYYD